LDLYTGTNAIERLRAAGLRGRGGGWFPAWQKWRAVRAEEGEAVVVANGAEGEPGSAKDQVVMLERPGQVLAGLGLAAQAVGARQAVVYLKGAFAPAQAALEAAMAEAKLDGLEVRIHRGDDSYVSGEETALLEVLEGRRAWPRPKPPLPAAVGYQGRPTLVQNVETLSRVPAALADPPAYRVAETTLLTLWGHVRQPGVYEVLLGTPLARVIEESGEGAPGDVGLVFPAGPSAAPLTGSDLATPLDPEALKARGSALGTASILVLGASCCPVAAAASAASFFERESCGQCPPCSLGSANLTRVVRGLETGETRAKELGSLREAAAFMSGHGYCAHGRTGANVVMGLLGRLGSEVEAHLLHGGCPRPEGACDPFAPESPERRALATALAGRLRA
jgi:NADH-quinone oxidoreductase subunit F